MSPSEQLETIRRVAAAAEAEDGAAPYDEATWLGLKRADGSVQAWVEPEAFAVLDHGTLSVAVDPGSRGRGVATRLLDRVLADAGDAVRAVWSHADHPAAARLAARHGFTRARELWVMRRPTSQPLPDLVLPPHVTIRSFRDDDLPALLRVNAASFAAHPEQGGMDEASFAERIAEPWWDPAGLLVAVDDDGRLLGFHWTKQHDAEVGEVYVVGIDPDVQGIGLGRLVTLAGLHHLAGLGVSEVILYVESDNAPAIRVYRDKLGFTHAPEDTHVMYVRAG
ncbi:mycothiol synthase [Nocardioides taihuensis]|uniref:Mycothiol acetyltransferase n=1 Tax=Nocardioides taihuensis TaxID=1835606 RepID=A0ABW0BEE0_9ACTN